MILITWTVGHNIYNTAQYNTVQYKTIQYNTVQDNWLGHHNS